MNTTDYHAAIEIAKENLKTVADFENFLALVEAYLLSEGVK